MPDLRQACTSGKPSEDTAPSSENWVQTFGATDGGNQGRPVTWRYAVTLPRSAQRALRQRA
jgi:hypothetical protein